jgi:hypothetical protein
MAKPYRAKLIGYWSQFEFNEDVTPTPQVICFCGTTLNFDQEKLLVFFNALNVLVTTDGTDRLSEEEDD